MTENRAELLMRQASITASQYMDKATTYVRENYPDIRAETAAVLIAAHAQAAAADFHACFLCDAVNAIAAALDRIEENGIGSDRARD